MYNTVRVRGRLCSVQQGGYKILSSKPPRYCSDSCHRGLMESNQPTTVNIFIPCNSHKSLTKDAISQLSSLLTRFEITGDCSRDTHCLGFHSFNRMESVLVYAVHSSSQT